MYIKKIRCPKCNNIMDVATPDNNGQLTFVIERLVIENAKLKRSLELIRKALDNGNRE